MAGPKVAASILSADFSRLGSEIISVVSAGADWIHLDIMDGHFVPNLTFGPPVVASLRKVTDAFFDAHLMVTEPSMYIDALSKASVNSITFHIEAVRGKTPDIIAEIKERNIKAAIALNPFTPIAEIIPYIGEIDMILIMSVNPGFGGQKLIRSTLDKARKLVEIRKKKNLQFLIQMDGGINAETITAVIDVGVDCVVSGSFIFRSSDRKLAISMLKKVKCFEIK